MSQSLSKMFVHITFHIKSNHVPIGNNIKNELYKYIGTVINDNNSIPIVINGVEDHIHILCILYKNISLAGLVEEIKRHSSRWMKTKGLEYKHFAWQGGYAGFSVCPSLCEKIKNYIENQEEHHKNVSFKEELLQLFHEYGIEYNEKYIWEF